MLQREVGQHERHEVQGEASQVERVEQRRGAVAAGSSHRLQHGREPVDHAAGCGEEQGLRHSVLPTLSTPSLSFASALSCGRTACAPRLQ